MKIIAVIPAYNEEKNLEPLITKIKHLAAAIDIVVVNDASSDQTHAVAETLGVRVIDLPINMGIGGAVQTGYIYAHRNDYDIAIQIDGDGQHDPSGIPELIAPVIDQRADMVIGSRFLKLDGFQSYFFRRIGIRIIRSLLWLVTGRSFSDPTSGLRVCSRPIIQLFAQQYPTDYPEPESLVTVCNYKFRITEIPVIMKQREGGISSIRGVRAIDYMLKVCLAILITKFKSCKT